MSMTFWRPTGTGRFLIAAVLFCSPVIAPSAETSAFHCEGRRKAPAWLFPLISQADAARTEYDTIKPLRIPGSRQTYTEAQLNDLFAAPDWFPQLHGPMPEVVARGRPPDTYACGYCHTPTGQGRPENASLAGLPADYIKQQLADFKSGARRSAACDLFRPASRMNAVGGATSLEDGAIAASYFAQQHLNSHVKVLERLRVPRSEVVGWVYVSRGGPDEPLGQRLLEFAPDRLRHELRDDNLQYLAYVPPGSVKRGKSIATNGGNRVTAACTGCHGPMLQGEGLVPRLAGRSPTYLLRQLLAFQTGARSGAGGEPMRAVVAHMRLGNMIDAVAYAASLPP